MRRAIAIASTFLLTIVAGCGADNGLSLARVGGRVTYKGEPVTYGSIMFMPDETKGTVGPQAVGTIKPDGTFVLSTEESGDGAVIGTHRVSIIGLDESTAAPAAAMPDPEVDPKAFMQAKTKAGMMANRKKADETYTDKSGKVFRMTIPSKLNNPATSDLIAEVGRGSNTVNIAIDEDGSTKVTQ